MSVSAWYEWPGILELNIWGFLVDKNLPLDDFYDRDSSMKWIFSLIQQRQLLREVL